MFLHVCITLWLNYTCDNNANHDNIIDKSIEYCIDIYFSQIMKKSVVTADFEKKHEILPYQQSLNQIKKQRQVRLKESVECAH